MLLQDFLLTHSFPGELLFAKVWGSHSHNTDLQTSDTDFLVVYVAPTKKILSLNPPAETVDGKGPDFQAHELKKFCSLLMKGNPAIVECLFTDRMHTYSNDWLQMRENRKRFLTKRCIQQYIGYARGQLHRLKAKTYLHTTGGKYNTKWAYHMIRLLHDATRIVEGGEPLVWKMSGTAERDLLMNIRLGNVSQEDVEKMSNQMVKDIDEQLLTSTLPEDGDIDWLNEWMLHIRSTK